jgi:hypothetical protein
MAGSGGTAAFGDPDTGICFGVTKNRASSGEFTTVEGIGRLLF